MEGLGFDPSRYSAHSLRKFRSTYIHSIGGSQLNGMLHDARSSEASNLPYVQTDPRNPVLRGPHGRHLGQCRHGETQANRGHQRSASVSPHRSQVAPDTDALAAGRPQRGCLEPGAAPGRTTRSHARCTAHCGDCALLQAAAGPPVEPPGQESSNSSTPARVGSDGAADPPNTDMQSIVAFQGVIGKLRSAGFDDSEIATLVGLRLN